MIRSHSSGVLSTNGLMMSIPALLTRTESGPSSASMPAMAASTLSRRVMSMPSAEDRRAPLLPDAGRGVEGADLVEIADRHRRARLRQRVRHRRADATRTTRDQCDPSRQTH